MPLSSAAALHQCASVCRTALQHGAARCNTRCSAPQLSMGSIVDASSGRSRRARKEVRPPHPPASSPFGIGAYSGTGRGGVRACGDGCASSASARPPLTPPPGATRTYGPRTHAGPKIARQTSTGRTASTSAQYRRLERALRSDSRGIGCATRSTTASCSTHRGTRKYSQGYSRAGSVCRSTTASSRRRRTTTCAMRSARPRAAAGAADSGDALDVGWAVLPDYSAPCRMLRTACCDSAAVPLAPARRSPVVVHVAAVGPSPEQMWQRASHAPLRPVQSCAAAVPSCPVHRSRLTSVPEYPVLQSGRRRVLTRYPRG